MNRFVVLLVSTLASRLAGQDCADMRGPEVKDLAAALDAAAAVGPVWSDYTIANHPIVFVSQSRDTAAAACTAIWRHSKPLVVIPTSRGMRLSTPLYAMWDADPIGPKPTPGNAAITSTLRSVPRELQDSLRAAGDTRVVVLPAPLRFENLGALGQALKTMGIKPTLMLAQLAIHESYHLHSQFPTWLDQPRRYEWPAWDLQPDRKALVERCYRGTPAVVEAHRKELAALEQSWQLAMREPDSTAYAAARAEGRAFVAARRARHALLAGVTIPSPGEPVRCERGEDVMELEEGAPQWMGYVTAVRAGLMRVEEVGRSSSEAFYVSGTFQLWILERLLGPSGMRSLTREITRSTDPSGAIFGRFAAEMARRR